MVWLDYMQVGKKVPCVGDVVPLVVQGHLERLWTGRILVREWLVKNKQLERERRNKI